MAKTATKQKKERKPSDEDLFVEKILAEVAAARKAKNLNPEDAAQAKALDDEAAELFRQTTNRDNTPKLDVATAIGRVERDGKPAFDRIGNWTPTMAVDPEMLKPFAVEIHEAKERIESEKFQAMSEAERELYVLVKEQDKALAAERANAEHAKWLAEPATKTTLTKLRALDERIAKDTSWNYEEDSTVAKAMLAIETVGADRDAALALANEAFAIDRKKKTDAMTAHEREIERLKKELELAGDKPSDATPPTPKPEADASILAELKAAEEAYLGDQYDALDLAGKTAAAQRYDAAKAAADAAQTPAA